MAKWAGAVLAITASLMLQGCESSGLFGGDPPAWPGADRSAYDSMESSTSCRATLAAPDCRVAQMQPAGGTQALRPAPR